MRVSFVLPLAALSSAFVVPDEQVLANLPVPESRSARLQKDAKSFLNKLPCAHHILDSSKSLLAGAKNALDHAVEHVEDLIDTGARKFVPGFDAEAWLEGASFQDEDLESSYDAPDHPPPPHHGPPHRGPHGKRPHHPPHHGGPGNKTIYELISESKYTTKLAKLVSEYDDIVKVLNSTKGNFTLFAPTDAAFAKIPEHGKKPPKEFIEKVLLYHVAPGLYPAGRLLFSHTVPTLFNETLLGDKPQRLVAKLGLKGVAINFYSKVVAVNIPATNGIIHGVDSLLIPPPKTLKILELLPADFSTLLLGLTKTGLIDALADATSTGGTFFAPGNGAFKKLGPGINAFLFSKRGEKYLKALLEYHVVANETLYSNTYYGPSKTEVEVMVKSEAEVGADAVPYFHFDLPTLLEDKSLAVDVVRYGPFITIKINGFVRVVVADGIAKDGVLHAVSNVLIPPRKTSDQQLQHWNGEQLSVDELVERLEPYVAEDNKFDL